MIPRAMGLKREDVYLERGKASLYQTKKAEALDTCKATFAQAGESVNPGVIVAFGDFSSHLLLRDEAPVARFRGQWRKYRDCGSADVSSGGALERCIHEKTGLGRLDYKR